MEHFNNFNFDFFMRVCDFESEGLMILVLTGDSCTFLRI